MNIETQSVLMIAIDGPSGAGKTTVACEVAKEFGLSYLDTGSMYRALALKVLKRGIDPHDQNAVNEILGETSIQVEGPAVALDSSDVTGEIRSADVTAAASTIAVNPKVREWMVERQRQLARSAVSGVVVEGRDIGTVVLPDATLKIFLTAGHAQRAERRATQERSKDLESTADSMAERDARDENRSESPLIAAGDAVVIDTSNMALDQTIKRVVQLIKSRAT